MLAHHDLAALCHASLGIRNEAFGCIVLDAVARREYHVTLIYVLLLGLTPGEVHAHRLIMSARIKAFLFFDRLDFSLEFDLLILESLLGFSLGQDDGLLVIKLLLEACGREVLPGHAPLTQGLFLDEHSLFIFDLSALYE